MKLPAEITRLDAGLLLSRLWFGGVLAFAHGLPKMLDLSGFVAGVGRNGMPMPWVMAPVAAMSELVGGLLLALGLWTRLAAIPVAGTMLVAGLWIHRADPFTKRELAFAYAVVALVLMATGPGKLSVDARLERAKDA